MMGKKKLPIGIESFEEIRKEGFYYVDKTGVIGQLLEKWGKVNLFTRPRRFGKSLNMSMLKAFFEIGGDSALFEGLKISEKKELCEKYMGQFPVISISLKSVEGLSFEAAKKALKDILGVEAGRFYFLTKSSKLTAEEIESYKALLRVGETGDFLMSDTAMEKALLRLSSLLCKHYGKQVILLIDEYDVPLDKAFQYGYYDEMVSLIRNMFGNALKTNPNLYFAVLTGCLRISKESIFTGLNNLKVLTLTDVRFDEYFGFTDSEVKDMLEYYGLSEHYGEVKEWYDGYRFGNVEVYCPWDVINYCDLLKADPNALPQDYWSNTSGNAMVRRFIDKADTRTRDEIERLIAGDEIVKEIHQELTYNELDSSIENLWSVLFTTGYLTQRGQEEKKYRLAIPNNEIRELFISQIREWFRDVSRKDGETLNQFCEAFPEQNPEKIEEIFSDYLWNTISIRDTASSKKENFYHGILLGLLGYKSNWLVKSNAESGLGYSDILVEVPKNRTGIVIELKYAEDGNMDAACEKALQQIEDRDYAAKLKDDGMRNIIKYGIACYKKNCKVVLG
ncbi:MULTISPECIES: AAA family ATPase [Blautia]|uniref:AAA family ATPase n=1 Tax=Blautia TaxID=572511 RepID=UPI001D082FFB|nr:MULTISPECIES: AAA family ATPase [Blautia]MCB6730901.1 ATP-binding protein [Blautia obeum]MCB6958317.1 ATP-binding protein [Blautia obeum]MCG4675355.1 ATP-binding protein [Blautia obeum]MDE8679752.1 AAA family ATPase [Blautia schinkii]